MVTCRRDVGGEAGCRRCVLAGFLSSIADRARATMCAMRTPSIASVLLASFALPFPAAAQRVSLKPEPGRGAEVERLVSALASPDTRGPAADKLWRLGAPAVPVL